MIGIEKETYDTIKTLEGRIRKQRANIEKNHSLIQKALRKGIECPKCGSKKIVAAIVRDDTSFGGEKPPEHVFQVNYYCVQFVPPDTRCDEVWVGLYNKYAKDEDEQV